MNKGLRYKLSVVDILLNGVPVTLFVNNDSVAMNSLIPGSTLKNNHAENSIILCMRHQLLEF